MKNKRIIWYIVFGAIITLGFVAVGILNKMMNPDVDKIHRSMNELGFQIETHQVDSEEGTVTFYRTGTPGQPKILLIHGSPGDWTAWTSQYRDSMLQRQFDIFAFDRPGFGKTSLSATANLILQGKAARAVMNQYPNERFLLVGHSYGGAVATQLALDAPEQISHLLYVAPTLEPNAQQSKWFNHLGRLLNPILSRPWKSSNLEMMGLAVSLQINEVKLDEITTSATWLMGEKDMLVPMSTMEYYKKHTTHLTNYLIDKKANHFIPWEQSNWLNDVLLQIGHSFQKE